MIATLGRLISSDEFDLEAYHTDVEYRMVVLFRAAV